MARKSAHVDGVRSVKAVFVKEPVYFGARRTFRYVRQPYNLVEYDWGNGERTTGLELNLGTYSRSRELNSGATATLTAATGREEYQDIVIFDGYGAPDNNWPRIDR